jgi:hypothetical protein
MYRLCLQPMSPSHAPFLIKDFYCVGSQLTNFKVLGLALDRGPLTLPLSALQFATVLLAPITPQIGEIGPEFIMRHTQCPLRRSECLSAPSRGKDFGILLVVLSGRLPLLRRENAPSRVRGPTGGQLRHSKRDAGPVCCQDSRAVLRGVRAGSVRPA